MLKVQMFSTFLCKGQEGVWLCVCVWGRGKGTESAEGGGRDGWNHETR